MTTMTSSFKLRSLADVEAFEKTPLSQRNLPQSTYEAIKRSAERYPKSPAIMFFLQGTAYEKTVEYSYQNFLGKLHQTANMLQDLGLGPKDTVSYILPNLPQSYLALYGGEAAGIANPINPLLEAETIADIMRAAQTKVLITLAPFPKTNIWEKIASIADSVPSLTTILQVDIAQYLGFKKLVVQAMRLTQKQPSLKVKVLDFDKTLAQYPQESLTSKRQFVASDIASYFHTGGTTGTPKLALHSHANEVFDSWVVASSIEMAAQKRNYLGLPLFHNYGAIAIGLGSFSAGACVVIGTPQGFRGEGVMPNLWKILAHYRCNTLGAVPTVYKNLLNLPIEGYDLSHLELTICGAAALPVELAKQFKEKTGLSILEGYGLTESTSVSSVNPPFGESKVGSVGLRFPYQEMRTAFLDGDKVARFCEVNETGIIVIRGPNVFPGYKESFQNKGVFVDSADGKGLWLNTGDLGYQDEDGYFWLTGREKELIIRGGHNIDPRQIEEPMHRHPAVALAAAVARPDAQVGELPVVYVELKPGKEASEAELLSFAEKTIGERAAIPKQIYIVPQMPLTDVGKLAKLPLIHAQIEEVFKESLMRVEGVESVEVQASSDKRLGRVAHVEVRAKAGVEGEGLEPPCHQALAHYAIHYDLKITP
ncbi:MAG: acyl-CoA synthetase [Deinococcales bacterium]